MNTDARSLGSEAQETLRKRAVEARLGGMRQKAVAAMLGVSREAVRHWMRAYRSGGAKALNARRRGRPQGTGRLQGWQAAAIKKLIIDRQPEQLKLAFFLWTRGAVQQLIKRKFSVSLSVTQVGRYLKQWGFTPQKPRRRAWEQDTAAVQAWRKEEYPALRARAKRQKAVIYWCDEMGVRSDHQAGTSYAPKGTTPVVRDTGRRFSCHMISAITNRGHLSFMVFKQTFTVSVMLRFLKRLLQENKRKIVLIADRHPVHRSAAVRTWLVKHRERIELVFLPSYSPELNPDEFLNQDVKTNAVGRRTNGTLGRMMRNVRTYLVRRRQQPELVRRYFHHQDVRYALV